MATRICAGLVARLVCAAQCGWMRSFAYCTGVSVAAGRIGPDVFVVVVAYLLAGDAVVGCAVRSPSFLCSLGAAAIIGEHTFKELGRLEAMVGCAPDRWFAYASANTLLVEYDVEWLYTCACVGAKMFVECMYVHHDGEGEWEVLRWRCECEYDYAVES
jgi:hypothetical protein